MKKQIENKTSLKGAKAADIKGRENELNHHLELITNIAQRIENENRTLMQKNKELKNDYKSQENDRELLLKQLVHLKKENAKIQEEVDYYNQVIQKDDNTEQEIKSNADVDSVLGGVAAKTMDAKSRVDHRQETEAEKVDRYERIIGKLKKTLESERKGLKQARQDY